MDQENKKTILGAVALIVSIIVIFFLIQGLNRIFNQPMPTPIPSTSVPPSQYPDYDITQNLKSISLIASASDRNDRPNQVGNRSGWLEVKGKIAKAYLYAEMNVNGKPISQYESLFIKMDYRGGHLFRPDSLKTPPSETRTRLLYSLRNVSYIPQVTFNSYPVGYSDSKPHTYLDWLTPLTTKTRVSFAGFFGSVIDGFVDVKLYYECDPVTPTCNITFTSGKI